MLNTLNRPPISLKPTSERLNRAEDAANQSFERRPPSTRIMIDVTHMAKLGWGGAVR
ncbi:hypothetical protein [Methylobacterium sp. E-046]|uniref:hypothetical protein n=1 Tax=Methylobacterium sp. E-046 TaxID=2836576 RepID=UPI001FBBDAAF|nr:hypothetical protein [Methylobacterium sp. E-046]MCJ2100024.1 hypothetical protein [Methylobacterium sp. E-046]